MCAGTLFLFPGIWEIRDDRSVSTPFFTILAPFTAWNTGQSAIHIRLAFNKFGKSLPLCHDHAIRIFLAKW